jgi:glycosyltransferase involved in cell wall biosynthesis
MTVSNTTTAKKRPAAGTKPAGAPLVAPLAAPLAAPLTAPGEPLDLHAALLPPKPLERPEPGAPADQVEPGEPLGDTGTQDESLGFLVSLCLLASLVYFIVRYWPTYQSELVALLQAAFWLSAALVGYTLVGYPLLLALAGRLWPRPHRVEPVPASISIILAVHNEEMHLGRRLTELTEMLHAGGTPGEIIVVSDGSTDGSVEVARAFEDRGVRVVALKRNQGKAAALSRAFAEARHEIVAFADARQRWAADALARLLENFADPRVGAVSGDLVLETTPGVMAGVGLYWRVEKWLRRAESRIGSQAGVTGAISAVRRGLLPAAIPAGTLLDDVYWPLCVAMRGCRVVHDERARAFDRLPDRPRDEFRRKIRTLAGNYQLVTLLPGSLLPWRNPVWPAWVSHKLLRLVVPWAMLVMLIASGSVPSPLYQALFVTQVAGYGLAMLGLVPPIGRRVKLFGAAASFLVLNAAAFLAFWVWVGGTARQSWRKVSYNDAAI